MPTWGQILEERNALAAQGVQPGEACFALCKKYLRALADKTQRATILYATKWTQPLQPGTPPELVSISEEDLQGTMEVIHGLSGPDLDIILHSPGGSPVAAEAVVIYLRSKFKHIRVIVPQAAMSAATMLACSADEIIL